MFEFLGPTRDAAALGATSRGWRRLGQASEAWRSLLQRLDPALEAHLGSRQQERRSENLTFDTNWYSAVLSAWSNRYGRITNYTPTGTEFRHQRTNRLTRTFERLSALVWRTYGCHQIRIVALGLDGAGKTTALYRHKYQDASPELNTVPTIGFNVETLSALGVNLCTYDVGGTAQIRPLWRFYYAHVNALLWFVDASAPERFAESREAFDRVLTDISETYPMAAVCVFANKVDKPGSARVGAVAEALGLNFSSPNPYLGNRKWCVQGCCAEQLLGLNEGMEWTASAIATSIDL